VTVVDVNPRERWREAHVPGALHMDPASFRAEDLPADKNSSLVFYCSNLLCRKAPNAARRAARFGYSDVSVMSAGIHGWMNGGFPTESDRGHEP
jgi:rhodanese-related sulfurtransferase